MAEDRSYFLGDSEIMTAAVINMKYESGSFKISRRDQSGSILIGGVDGGEEDVLWGRFVMETDDDGAGVLIVHVFALNEQKLFYDGKESDIREFICNIGDKERKTFFSQAGESVGINRNDILLYTLKGRYLWIYIEVIGKENFSCRNIRVDMVGDNFMASFPEIYQERNSFFHRYLSVMSSEYNDFAACIKRLPDLFDIEKAPVGMLQMYAGWFGIDLEGVCPEEKILRKLMRELFGLIKKKGTREAMERLAEIMLGEKAVIVERNLMQEQVDGQNAGNKEIADRLYGSSPYDVCLLVRSRLSEREKSCLTYLLEQFKPVRCRLRIIDLKDSGNMDGYTYLGSNAVLKENAKGVVDGHMAMDEEIVLQ